MSDGQSQRQQGGLPQHLTGQANGVYDPRQQGSNQLMTPPPSTQTLQQQQDHRASMLEALQGQRGPPRMGGPPGTLGGGIKVPMTSRGFQNEDQKVAVPL